MIVTLIISRIVAGLPLSLTEINYVCNRYVSVILSNRFNKRLSVHVFEDYFGGEEEKVIYYV